MKQKDIHETTVKKIVICDDFRLAFVTYSYEHIDFDHRKGGWIWHSIYFIALYCGRRKWFIFEQTQMLKLRTVGEDTVNTTAKVKMVRFLPPV